MELFKLNNKILKLELFSMKFLHDFHATVLNLLGMDHERLIFRSQGLDLKLTGVEPAKVIRDLIA